MTVTSALASSLGYKMDELQAMTWQEITHPDDIRLTASNSEALLNGDCTEVQFEKRFVEKNGSVIWAELTTLVQREPQGQSLFLMSAVSDVTMRKNADQQLAASEARYRSYVEATGQIAWVTDSDGQVVEDVPSLRNATRKRQGATGKGCIHRPRQYPTHQRVPYLRKSS